MQYTKWKKNQYYVREISYNYKVIKVDINNGDQFKEEFKKISPFSKIPVINDHKKNKTILRSGAILIYLAEQSSRNFIIKKIELKLING